MYAIVYNDRSVVYQDKGKRRYRMGNIKDEVRHEATRIKKEDKKRHEKGGPTTSTV